MVDQDFFREVRCESIAAGCGVFRCCALATVKRPRVSTAVTRRAEMSAAREFAQESSGDEGEAGDEPVEKKKKTLRPPGWVDPRVAPRPPKAAPKPSPRPPGANQPEPARTLPWRQRCGGCVLLWREKSLHDRGGSNDVRPRCVEEREGAWTSTK
jgi:hypothetical protein